MEKITIQDGGNDIFAAIAHLGLPIGLSVLANKYEPKKDKKDEKQQGGAFLSDSLLLEAGLAVVPFGLIALTEKDSDKEKSQSEKKK